MMEKNREKGILSSMECLDEMEHKDVSGMECLDVMENRDVSGNFDGAEVHGKMKEYGTLYGIGVGPGDPELLTVKAVKRIKEAEVLLLPVEPKEECYAYRIVKSLLPEIGEKQIVCRSFPMSCDKCIVEKFHEQVSHEILEFLREGKHVAFLTLGDPTVYSTYHYIHRRVVSGGAHAEIISGIPSFCAVAARLGISLADRSEQLHVIPGSYDVDEALQLKGTLIFMKTGKKLKELCDYIQEKMKPEECEIYAVSNCGMENEQVYQGRQIFEATDSTGEYLTTVIVRR